MNQQQKKNDVLLKPIKKRYREFMSDFLVATTSDSQKSFDLQSTPSLINYTPPLSPNQPGLVGTVCEESIIHTNMFSDSEHFSHSQSSHFMVFSPGTTVSAAPSPHSNDIVSDCDGKVHRAVSSSLAHLVDRQSICQYLDVYLDLYRIKGCQNFSNYLVDLVLNYLSTPKRNVEIAGNERFLFHYNMFYQQLIRTQFFNSMTINDYCSTYLN